VIAIVLRSILVRPHRKFPPNRHRYNGSQVILGNQEVLGRTLKFCSNRFFSARPPRSGGRPLGHPAQMERRRHHSAARETLTGTQSHDRRRHIPHGDGGTRGNANCEDGYCYQHTQRCNGHGEHPSIGAHGGYNAKGAPVRRAVAWMRRTGYSAGSTPPSSTSSMNSRAGALDAR
jgi:hypothetical protein